MTMDTTHTLNLDLGERSYPIYIGANLLDQPNLLTQHIAGQSALIVSNTKVAPLYLAPVKAALASQAIAHDELILEDGEAHKTLSTVERILDHLLTHRHDRQTTIIALGGGVIGDIAGFAASIYQRGVNFIQIPTTLLAQVDSSVGGKTGVNHALGKNMIGAFYQPRCVIADITTLDTLPPRELAAGMAEVIKYGLIHDADFFAWLEQNIDALINRKIEALAQAVLISCRTKAHVVELDEREGGLRAILNLGHTFGHAIETVQGYGQWLHGEAVAAGMMMAIDLSIRHHWIDEKVRARTLNLFQQAGLPVSPPKDMTTEQFLQVMAIDKKSVGGTITLILLQAIGRAVVSVDYQHDKLLQTLKAYCESRSGH